MKLTQADFGLVAGLASTNPNNRRRTVSRWETGGTISHQCASLIEERHKAWEARRAAK